MKLDYFTLFAVMGFIDLIIVIILIFYISTVSHRKWFITTYLIYKSLESIAMIGFGLRDTVSDLFSVYISNVLYFIFTFLHIISVVSYKGSLNKRFAYAIGSILLLCIPLFLVFRDNEQYRVIFSSYGIASAYVTGAIFLFANRKPYKLPILLAAGFLLFGVINIFRGTNIFFIIGEYRFTDLTSWDMIFVLTGIVTILVSSFGFLLLLKEVDDSIIFRQNKLSETAFDQSPVSVVITDDEGNIQYVNPNFSQLTGYTPDEVKGKKANVLRTPMTPNETFQDLWKTVKSGEIWRGEFVNKKKNNEIYYEEAVIAPIKDERLNIVNFLAIKTDITQRKMDEALIQKRNMELSELNSTKDRMFSIIAHDLKGPIGNLQQLLEIIDHDINKGNTANVYELLDILKGTSRTAFELLDNLLAWARSQLNAISINPETFDLSSTITDALNLLNGNLMQKNISLSREYQGECMVFADKAMIETVIRNLLSNAIKFTPANGNITITLETNELDTILSVKDSGIGIEEERIEKVFNFAETQSTRGTEGEKGTGLGLILSKEFMLKNNGRIWFESAVNSGSTFYIALPREKAAV